MATSSVLHLPENINPLSPNGFTFSISKLPNVSFFCQRVTLPNVGLPAIEQMNPFSNRPIPGEIMQFSELSVQFLIDEQMLNYASIFNWMVALGFPESYDQYKAFVNVQQDNLYTELAKNYSDGTLGILDSHNNTTKAFKFFDMFPVSLDAVQFESTAMDVNYVLGNATFRYSYFTIDNQI
jgi:hypothetical protein